MIVIRWASRREIGRQKRERGIMVYVHSNLRLLKHIELKLLPCYLHGDR